MANFPHSEDEAIEQVARELGLPPWKPWYMHGSDSAEILYARLKHRWPRPAFRAHMAWQRIRRGWSDEDTWNFHDYLQSVIKGGIGHMRKVAHGHPGEITFEHWLQILEEITWGMEAAEYYEEHGAWEEDGEEAFDLAMRHLREWWFHLWD